MWSAWSAPLVPWLRIIKTLMSNQTPNCPSCKSDNVAAIAFGYPGPEMSEAASRGEIVLGGCIVNDDDPEWHCKDCKHNW